MLDFFSLIRLRWLLSARHCCYINCIILHHSSDEQDAVPPSFHNGLHIVNARVAADVRRLKSLADLCRFLQLHHLLGSLHTHTSTTTTSPHLICTTLPRYFLPRRGCWLSNYLGMLVILHQVTGWSIPIWFSYSNARQTKLVTVGFWAHINLLHHHHHYHEHATKKHLLRPGAWLSSGIAFMYSGLRLTGRQWTDQYLQAGGVIRL